MRGRILALTVGIMGLVLTNGCGKRVKEGDTIKIQYTGTLEDGTVFDSSRTGEPLKFSVGGGQVIPGLNKAVEGMRLNEEKEVTIKAEDAYGKRDEALINKVPRVSLPKGFEPKEGSAIRLQGPRGKPRPARIIAVSEDSITIDLNHPLAGKDLTFKIKVVGIE